jgi:prefoldin subunit 5
LSRLAFCGKDTLVLPSEETLEFVRHATAELAVSFTDARDHNLHAALNGLMRAVEEDRARITALEAELQKLHSQQA